MFGQVQAFSQRQLQRERVREIPFLRLERLIAEPTRRLISLPTPRTGKVRRKKRRAARFDEGLILVPGFTARALRITKRIRREDLPREARRLTRGVGIAAIPIIIE